MEQATDIHWATTSSRPSGRTETFEHDAVGRLSRVLEGASVREQYTIDTLGNLTDTHDGRLLYTDPSRPYAATELDGPSGGTFEYDAAGNARRAGELEIAYTQQRRVRRRALVERRDDGRPPEPDGEPGLHGPRARGGDSWTVAASPPSLLARSGVSEVQRSLAPAYFLPRVIPFVIMVAIPVITMAIRVITMRRSA
ncbi:MAG: hypothetical protein U0353_18670 [Sandaracinus sp.]